MTGSAEELNSALSGFSAQVHLAQDPKTIISMPGQVKQAITHDTKIEISINNQENLEVFIVAIPPAGNIESAIITEPTIKLTVEAVDGVGIGEFLLLASNDMDGFIAVMPELLQELNSKRSPTSKPRTTDNPKYFAISLPIQINSK
ncbi:MAG: hypothetical protein HC860_17420 [Alkalinema sp. RU_4_3]|nr:hypothetical protein [Alkalinema sp. RU_4_3]